MQQFATTQTSIAANKVPFEDVKLSSTAPRDASNSTYDNTSRKSAFEEALAKQEQSSQSDSRDTRNDGASQRADSAARNDAAKQARQESVDRANEHKSTKQRKQALNEQQKETDLRQRNEQAEQLAQKREQAQLDRAENNTAAASIDDKQSAANAGLKSETKDSSEDTAGITTAKNNPDEHCDDCASHADASDSGDETAESDEQAFAQNGTLDTQNIADEFDWVSYVNQVKDLSSSSGSIPNDLYVDDSEHSGDEMASGDPAVDNIAVDIFAQTIAALNNQSDIDKTANPVNADILDAGADTEFLEINLSEQELATLINAAGGNSEEQLALNSEAMAELDQAIAKLLNQLVSQEDTDAQPSLEDASSNAEKDSELLKDFLQAATELKDNQKVPMPLETIGDETANVKLKESLAQAAEETAADKSADLAAVEDLTEFELISDNLIEGVQSDTPNDQYLVPKPLELNEDKQSIVADIEAELAAVSLTQSLKGSPEQADKVKESPLFVAVDKASTKKQTEVLAKLPAEAESSAIENIATRVESVISDLKTEGKSTEFIAALQSGVKEMKEQLKQGREPGIDLKTLVTDALSEVDVKVGASKEQALDKQLTQVTNILAAATSLSQSNQQQNYLNTGLNEVQGMKEIGQQQLESTRLAQQTVVNEKAVNIFKPEGQQQLAEKVRWMANTRNLSAEIRLDPPDLGGMNIKVSVSGDSASVSFVVQSQQAREALDQAAPRLREMLEEQGIELGQSSVEQDSSGANQQAEDGSLANNSNTSSNLAQQSQDGHQDSQESANANAQGDGDAVIEQRISGGRIGGIDYYA